MENNKDWIRNFWSSCNKEKQDGNDLWSRVSEMVGYLNTNSTTSGSGEQAREQPVVAVGADCTLSPLGERREEEASVKRVVCSPDLSVFQPPAQPTPADSTNDTLQCTPCNKTFMSRSAHQVHMKTHKEGEDPYQCNCCGKTFAVPARLTRHYRTHTGEKPYQCEYCHKSFSVKENLSVHRRIHTKERPYKCEICERAFEHSGKLHRHMRIHTGERPHKCAVCSKTFIQSGQLVIHMRTHTGEKPYVCKDCGKGFTCSKQLKVHNRTHTGEKPYSCDICGKSFGYNHVLKLHQVAHYGEKVYKCTICNETFTSKKTMESHIKSHSESGRTEEGSTNETETSCASSTSDKENNKSSAEKNGSSGPGGTNTSSSASGNYSNMRELCGYLYRNERAGGLNPALLAAVAVATSENGPEYRPSPDHVLETPSGLAEPPVYLVPEPVACIQRKRSYTPELILPDMMTPEEEEELLTPPSSNPVSPVPSSSPEPVDLKEVISLPPRKRTKAILKSMESETSSTPPVRYSSVIHYAKAS
uniref:Kruppel-like protein 1 n=1 Tax=Rhodnius prolixus TaxID=13249 RepID=G9HZT2_RHOPR|nr:Kruppel-like protein 1 [Rhodnius prolixus]